MQPMGPKPADAVRQTKPIRERRHSLRHRVHSPAYADLNGSSSATAPDLNEILDISEEGMSVQTSSRLEVAHHLNLCLDLSETNARIRTTGQVVWSDASGRAGIRFPTLSGRSLVRLKEWLFVNVLTAYDHARGWVDGDEETSEQSSNAALVSYDRQKHEFPSRTPESSGNGGSLAEPALFQRELRAGGYDREAALQLIAERALTFTRATGAAVALSEGDAMICVASAGSDAPPLGSRLQASSGFSAECIRTGRSLRCDDSETDDRVDRGGCRALGIRSIVAVPIRFRGKVAGLLEVFSSQPYAFNANDIGVLQQLTGNIASALGHGAEIAAPPAERQKTPPPKTRPPRVEDRPVVAETPPVTKAVVKTSAHPVHRVLLVAAFSTFIFVLLWAIAPWISGQIRSERASAQGQRPQPSVAKAATLPADANINDLAGLRKLAERGDPAAEFALGARYATGEEVNQDYGEAVRWFSQAADRGHILAQATLGAYYWAGRGVPPDLTKAYFWSVLAQAGGDQASKYRVAVLASRMTRSQVLAAQQQANDWLRNHQIAGNVPSSE
jgi:hypothetical protein